MNVTIECVIQLFYEMEWIRLRLSSKKLAEINQMITMPIISSQQQIIIIIIKDKIVKRKITINKPNALRYGTILQCVYLTYSKKLTGIASLLRSIPHGTNKKINCET